VGVLPEAGNKFGEWLRLLIMLAPPGLTSVSSCLIRFAWAGQLESLATLTEYAGTQSQPGRGSSPAGDAPCEVWPTLSRNPCNRT
jgi:hypothetical protein